MPEDEQKYTDPARDKLLAIIIAGGAIDVARDVLGKLLFWRWLAARRGESPRRIEVRRHPDDR